ncbi:response regulator [Glaciecola siphonariae]|uniref:Response regulator n=1 Tax=Glaciecola siphonariae TaxID=521012 RepID=A0ABV9LVA4_9ALTE
MNSLENSPFFVLLADDDEDDRLLAQDAMEAAGFGEQCKTVEDGQQLLQFLRREGEFADASSDVMPSVILLDLNMPILDGRDTLKQLKEDAILRRIPVVIFSTSNSEEDVTQGYDLGAASYMVKPTNFDTLVEMMKTFGHYWSDHATVPQLPH